MVNCDEMEGNYSGERKMSGGVFLSLLDHLDELHRREEREVGRRRRTERFRSLKEGLTTWDGQRARMLGVFFFFKVGAMTATTVMTTILITTAATTTMLITTVTTAIMIRNNNNKRITMAEKCVSF